MSARGVRLLLDEVRQGDLALDPWGVSLAWHFAIADTLHAEGEEVPASWQFVPSPLGPSLDDPAADVVRGLWLAGHVDADDLRGAGEILSRFEDVLRAEGRDY
ncbi:hypothetical protein [Knoellia koreensis]|uniref:Uncharacterized protein n=1 Tax=Knoellia koreensis TaxID=2730921 RepID=A0A849HCV9_9MICO|nr:hypothetical protein [Knoellia sp. DB2414S]NNM44514.1 hypothetical protein [Knoellia sp. DB2414S]